MDLENVPNVNYKLMCRLCLSSNDCLLSVFDENYTFLPQRIAACVNVEVHKTDKMPTSICKQCLAKVEEWHEFKKCCEDSQSKLRHWTNYNTYVNNSNLNSVIQIKEEIASDTDDQIQIVESSICIKSEPVDTYLNDNENSENVISSEQSTSAQDTPDSLLVPSFECPAVAHGINAPEYSVTPNVKISSLSKACRICQKIFSNAHNRIRHERNVHYLDKPIEFFDSQLEPEISNVHSVNSEESSSNVTLEQFAASLQLVQNKASFPKTISEKHFVEFNRRMSIMLSTKKCQLCDTQYAQHKGIHVHLSKIIFVESFYCYLCCIKFPNRSQFMKHGTKKYCKQRARLIQGQNCPFKAYQHYQCNTCEELHVHKILLTRHLLSHQLNPHPESCSQCDKIFHDVNEYKEHLKSSCYYKLYCSICKISYDSEEFAKHTSVHDDDNKKFDFSDFLINKDYSCKRRLSKIKDESANYSCGRCGDLFSTLDMWCEHQKTHSDTDVHQCHECNRVFVTEEELNSHKGSHNNIKLTLYRCSDTNSYKAVSGFNESSDSQQPCKEAANETKSPVIDNKTFTCNICKKKYATYKTLYKHKRMHKDNLNCYKKIRRKFTCQNCSKIFKSIRTYTVHKKTCTMGNENPVPLVIKKESAEYIPFNNAFVCSTCNKSFPTERGLLIHSKLHTARENVSEKLECQVCYAKFLNIELLLDHLKSHSTKIISSLLHFEKPEIVCKYCKKTFLTNAGLSSHLKTHDPSELVQVKIEPADTVKCNFCDAEFENRLTLNRHIKIHLNGANIVYNCTLCPKVCSNSYTLAVHVKHRHGSNTKMENDESNLKCHICKKKFLTNALFQKHMKSHAKASVSKKYKCENCLKILPSAKALSRHMKSNCLFCTLCNKTFLSIQAFISHKGWHSRREGNALFNCAECNAGFNVQSDYVKHLKTHKKKYKCKYCPKSFHYMKSLLTHTAQHHNGDNLKAKPILKNYKNSMKIKPKLLHSDTKSVQSGRIYKCTECNTIFNNAKNLRLHVLSAHIKDM